MVKDRLYIHTQSDELKKYFIVNILFRIGYEVFVA